MGPGIARCCYEISQKLMDEFRKSFSDFSGFYQERNLDLFELNAQQARRAGVPKNQIFASGICTHCRKDSFFSYRRDKQNAGRMISTMMIKNEHI
jgi:copper oxidase (laccase) domain-containing protein